MVSDPRFLGLKSHEKYELTLTSDDDTSDDVYLIATPAHGMENIFYIEPEPKLNLSSCVGFDEESSKLVWDQSGFHHRVSDYQIWHHPSTGERYLRVIPRRVDENGKEIHQKFGQEDAAKEEQEEWPSLNLDECLDIVEEYDSSSGELKLRLGPKPNVSKRSIILCFDGYSNHFSNRNSNIVKLMELLKKDDPSKQVVYYQTGVSTYSHPGFLSGISAKVTTILDEAFGWYLSQHVIDGYKYLMETYQAGDQISIFGLSRGAYTARALAGMLHSVGLLPKHNLEQVPFAYQVYARSEEDKTLAPGDRSKVILGAVDAGTNHDQSVKESARPENVTPEYFKMAFCTPVQIAFLGVWDTVASVDILTRKSLPWIEYNPSVKHFRHALALDESRGSLIPSVWDHSRTQGAPKQGETRSAIEVWFKGSHSDIGGGAPPIKSTGISGIPILGRCLRAYQEFSEGARFILQFNGLLPACMYSEGSKSPTLGLSGRWRSPDLSNISLRWMARQCLSHPEARILFDPYSLYRYRKARILEERPQGAESAQFYENGEELDKFDISKGPYIARSEVSSWWRWWFLECMPVSKPSQRESRGSRPKTVYWPKLRVARSVKSIEEGTIFLHYSVYAHIKQNQAEKTQDYPPAAEWYNWLEDEWPHLEDAPSHMRQN